MGYDGKEMMDLVRLIGISFDLRNDFGLSFELCLRKYH